MSYRWLVLTAIAFCWVPFAANSQSSSDVTVSSLESLKKLYDDGIITQEAYLAGVNKLIASGPAVTPVPQDDASRATALYKSRDFNAVVTQFSGDTSADPKLQSVVALSHLRLGDLNAARDVQRSLASVQSTAQYAGAVGRAIAVTEERLRIRDALGETVLTLDRSKVDEAIESSNLPQEQKSVLRAHIAVYAADFSHANSLASALSEDRRSDLLAYVNDRQQAHDQLMLAVEEILYSPVAATPVWHHLNDGNPICDLDHPRFTEFPLLQYFEMTDLLLSNYPLSPVAQDLAFHAAMFSMEDEEFFQFGNRILSAKGTIRIPFYGNGEHIYLTIDLAKNRILTESVDKSFILDWCHGEFVEESSFLRKISAFSYSFSEITSLRQDVKHYAAIGALKKRAYAIRVNRKGIAPEYAFIRPFHYFYGPQAQKEVSLRLANFILGVIGTEGIKTSLADPEKQSGGGVLKGLSTFTAIAAAVGGMQAASVGDTAGMDQMNQILSQHLEGIEAINYERSLGRQGAEAWSDQFANEASMFDASGILEELEILLVGE